MRLQHKLWLVLSFFAVQATFAQATKDFVYTKYNWESEPKIQTLSNKDLEGNFVILKDKIIIQFAYEASGELVEYLSRHLIVHFNNEKGIEEMNKVYIPKGNILEEIELKARTIKPDGKVIPLSKSSIKTVDNLRNAGAYIMFAMEGIEKGGEIEYLYTNKVNANTNSSWTLQTENTRRNIEVDIYSPNNLVFEAKGYNGFAEFKTDTTIPDKRHIYSAMPVIEGLLEEKYSTYEANKMRFDYELTYNTAKGKARLYSWEYCGNQIYNTMFNFSKPEQKVIEKLIAKLNLKNFKTDEEKIRALELYMKTTISLNGDDNRIDKMMELKYGSRYGLQRLYVGVAKILDIPVEGVVTTDRDDAKFDKDFATWNSLKEYLVYFPGFDKYLCATNYSSRLGFPPSGNIYNYGLFIKETGVGDIKTGISKIKFIEAPSHTLSHNNITASVTFNPETFTPTINYKQEFLGYNAFYLQSQLYYAEEAQKKEIVENLAKFIGAEPKLISKKYSGANKEDILVKPLVIESVLEVSEIVENAGSKYLFKVGDIIGPQVELYQEKERQSQGEIDFLHSFNRSIQVKIPKGYQIKNLQDIKMDKKCIIDGKETAKFLSDYKLEGDMLTITAYEDYTSIIYPKAEFEKMRIVINAAADFNKVVLIFEKL